MRRRGLHVLWLTGVISAILIAPVRAAEAGPDDVEALIAKGNELRRRGDPTGALPLFQKAFELARTPRTEGQLGLAEMAAGDPVSAETHLSAALASPQHPWVAANRTGLEQTLARARGHICELTIDGEPQGATVVVNGRQVGVLPLAAPLRLVGGRNDVAVSAPGYSTSARWIQLAPGEHRRLTVSLDRVPNPGTAPSTASTGASSVRPPAQVSASPAAQPEPPASRRDQAGATAPSATTPVVPPTAIASAYGEPPASGLRTAAWLAAGGGVVALGAGIGLEIAALAKTSEFNNSCLLSQGSPVPNGKMPSVTAMDCSTLWDTHNSEKTWSIVGFVAGGALAATAGVLFWSSRAPQTPGQHARLECAPTLAGISCRGVF
jgi:hypothetical protein